MAVRFLRRFLFFGFLTLSRLRCSLVGGSCFLVGNMVRIKPVDGSVPVYFRICPAFNPEP